MRKSLLGAAATALLATAPAMAGEGAIPNAGSVPQFDHVFVIMMENHSEQEIIGNANAPFMTAEAQTANSATRYFAVGHPSLTNYLELNGGSNFGITNDIWPVWNNGGCVDNSGGGGCAGAVPALSGGGTDVATPATATTTNGECNGQLTLSASTGATNDCAIRTYAAASYIAKTIADQLVEHGMSWKTYQESLPTIGSRVDGVNFSDGAFSNLQPTSFFNPPAPAAKLVIPKLYAVKHDPFVYFDQVQAGVTKGLTEAQVQDFDGQHGLYADLASGKVPNYAFIAPNQCHDIHMLSSTENACNQNATAIAIGDAEVKKLVSAIKASPVWHDGHSVIVILFDENDYADAPNVVPFIVDKNYGPTGVQSSTAYDHFSLLRTLEAGFGLPCLNHACDATSAVMTDLFGADSHHGNHHGHDNI